MKRLAPVYLGFFAMGFVDVVGIATNYAKLDFHLRGSLANVLPFTVFVWFALLSVPLGSLMNRIGRRATVIAGLGITAVSMVIPLCFYHFSTLLIGFAGVGIGNTILQVSLNPLLTNVVRPAALTSALTAGQLAKSLASFLGPVAAGAASLYLGNWHMIFAAFAGVALLNGLWLWATPITEERHRQTQDLSVWSSLRLLADKDITLLVLGVVAIVGIDVGINTMLPGFVMTRLNLPLEKAGLATSLYFFSRTAGSLAGIPLLARASPKRVLLGTAVLGLIALSLVLAVPSVWMVVPGVVLFGLAVANVFPILFGAALQRAATAQNEVSGLMIMGVAGGAVLLPLMGWVADSAGAGMALGLLACCWIFLGAVSFWAVRVAGR